MKIKEDTGNLERSSTKETNFSEGRPLITKAKFKASREAWLLLEATKYFISLIWSLLTMFQLSQSHPAYLSVTILPKLPFKKVCKYSNFLKHLKPAFYAGYQQGPLINIDAKSIPQTYS